MKTISQTLDLAIGSSSKISAEDLCLRILSDQNSVVRRAIARHCPDSSRLVSKIELECFNSFSSQTLQSQVFVDALLIASRLGSEQLTTLHVFVALCNNVDTIKKILLDCNVVPEELLTYGDDFYEI